MALCTFVSTCNSYAQNKNQMIKPVIVVHGGAGTILKENMTDEAEAAYRNKLIEALTAGHVLLKNGSSSQEAVVAAIKVLEDSPLFNAGKGSVYTHNETNEMDASIMRGSDLNAGAVAGVATIKNPIEAAHQVMDFSEHVMLAGSGAVEFAKKHGAAIVDSSYFYDELRLKQLKNAKENERILLDHDGDRGSRTPPSKIRRKPSSPHTNNDKFGTVGCVALDQYGNVAAGTSTGGMTNKRYGRIGDSPLIGAGTYADNNTCAVSATGHGEYFIRLAVAKEISTQMEHGGKSLSEASEHVIHTKLTNLGGSGGVICVDTQGNIAMPFNTSGMFRGAINSEEKIAIRIFKNE